MHGTSHEVLARYLPALLVQRANRNQTPDASTSVDGLKGAVLHVAVDGFEELAEVVGEREPEKVLQMTDRWFGKLVRMVADSGGDILHLSSRTIIALWVQDDEEEDEDLTTATLRAGRCALEMQQVFEPHEVAPNVTVGLRMGVGAGNLKFVFVGGQRNRWESLALGAPLVQAERAASAAPVGQVLLERAPWTLIRFRSVGGKANESMAQLQGIEGTLPVLDTTYPMARDEALKTMWSFTPGPVRAAIAADSTTVQSDRRNVSVIRIYLDHLDAHNTATLQRAFEEVQRGLYRHEGTLLHLRASGEGATLVAVLGLPPLPHSDDPARATAVALDAFRAFDRHDIPARVGVASGPAIVGDIGSEARRSYIVVGKPMRQARTLAQHADHNVLCGPETYVASQSGFEFTAHPPAKFMGQSLPAHRAVAVRDQAHRGRRPLVGRKSEATQLVRVLEMLTRGSRSRTVVIVEGRAGTGKTRLLQQLSDEAVKRNLFPLTASGDPVDGRTPYQAFAAILGRVLGLDGIDLKEIGQERLTARLQSSPESLHYAPLLNDLLPIRLPENEVTAELSGGRRATATHSLVMELMRGHAEGRATVLALDDAQYIDAESWALVTRALDELKPMLLVIATESINDNSPPELRRLASEPESLRIQLGPMLPDLLLEVVANTCAATSLPEQLHNAILCGPPRTALYGEQLGHELIESGTLSVSDGRAELAKPLSEALFPATVEALIQRRIARLGEGPRTTIEVASVVGRRFTFELLHDVFPGETDMMGLGDDLAQLARLELAPLAQREPEEVHQFIHDRVQQAVYASIPAARKKELHAAVGAWYEQEAADSQEPGPLARLALHFREAGDAAKAANYITQAADFATRAGAWEHAVEVLDEGLTSVGDKAAPDVTARWDRQIGESLYRSGQLSRSRQHLESALQRLGLPVPSEGFPLRVQLLRERFIRFVRNFYTPSAPSGAARERLSEQIRSNTLLAEVAWQVGNRDRAQLLALRAVNAADALGPSAELARAYTQLALITAGMSTAAKAAAFAEHALEVAGGQNDPDRMGPALYALGSFFAGMGRWPEAFSSLERSIELANSRGETDLALRARDTAALARFSRAEYTGATQIFEENEHFAASPAAKVRALAGQAESLMRTGWLDQAEALAAEAEHWLSGKVPGPEVARLFAIRSLSRYRRKDWNGARSAAFRAIKLLPQEHTGDPGLLEAYGVLAEILVLEWERTGDEGKEDVRIDRMALDALRRLERFADIHPIGRPRLLVVRASNEWRSGSESRALASFREAASIAAKLELPYEQAFAKLELGRRLGFMDQEGREALTKGEQIFQSIGANLERDRCILALEGR